MTSHHWVELDGELRKLVHHNGMLIKKNGQNPKRILQKKPILNEDRQLQTFHWKETNKVMHTTMVNEAAALKEKSYSMYQCFYEAKISQLLWQDMLKAIGITQKVMRKQNKVNSQQPSIHNGKKHKKKLNELTIQKALIGTEKQLNRSWYVPKIVQEIWKGACILLMDDIKICFCSSKGSHTIFNNSYIIKP